MKKSWGVLGFCFIFVVVMVVLFCLCFLCVLGRIEVDAGSWSFARSEGLDSSFNLVPFPAKSVQWTGESVVRVSDQIDSVDSTAVSALSRFADSWKNSWKNNVLRIVAAAPPSRDDEKSVVVSVEGSPLRIVHPRLGDDESYVLNISAASASSSVVVVSVRANTSLGVLRAIATLQQLRAQCSSSSASSSFSCLPVDLIIEDGPVRAWRGLMLDVARHFLPVSLLRDVLDGMERAKLNTLHLHLSDDQAFRFEMFDEENGTSWSRLNRDSLFYTRSQLSQLVADAADRGIRIVPEFDVPGHAGAILLAMPELNQAAAPSSPVQSFGVFEYCLDPKVEQSFALVDQLVRQSSLVFADEVFHLGGDEVNWGPALLMQSEDWMRANNVTDLFKYFMTRAADIVRRAGKKPAGWQEISSVVDDALIQWWRRVNTSFAPSQGIVSSGLYLDRLPSAEDMIRRVVGANMLGGELCLWTEWAGNNTLTRLFPIVFIGGELLWREEIVKTNARPRLAVVGAGFSPPERSFTSQVALFAEGRLSEWQYDMDTEQRGPLFEAMRLLCVSLAPEDRVDIGGPSYALTSLADVVRPDSPHLWAMSVLASNARGSAEAKSLLKAVLSDYSVLANFTFGDPVVAQIGQDLALLANRTLKYLETGLEQDRRDALAAGSFQLRRKEKSWLLSRIIFV